MSKIMFNSIKGRGQTLSLTGLKKYAVITMSLCGHCHLICFKVC